MNDKVKLIVNTLPLVLVPLIRERKKIKEHPDVKHVTETTVDFSHKVKDKTIETKDKVAEKTQPVKSYVVQKKRLYEYNKQMKQPFKEEQKEAKQQQKEIDHLDKKLQKNIDARNKEEEKVQKENKKARIKELTHYQNVEEQQAKKGEKLQKENEKDVTKLDKKLQSNIEAREQEEQKLEQQNKEERIKEIKKYEGHQMNTATTQSSNAKSINDVSSKQAKPNIQELVNERVRNEKEEKSSHLLFNQHKSSMSQHISQFPYDEHTTEHQKSKKRFRRNK
ncbi:hypothetical protein [Mammaliicoccus sciuri]|uniref:Uncharacterized protein n=1 Tax=Mammaliicoccus sciuri TaxID=1296 RepID=A0AAW5LKU2_MAMSC|nr:hypothetical protein [Mammaliicoccus sciuri]MCQ9302343.1 hypothetical protein [Mammaliicoccus sciuri]